MHVTFIFLLIGNYIRNVRTYECDKKKRGLAEPEASLPAFLFEMIATFNQNRGIQLTFCGRVLCKPTE